MIVTANNLTNDAAFDCEDAVETWFQAVLEFGAGYQRGADARQTATLWYRRDG
jgi:hypothetical protein